MHAILKQKMILPHQRGLSSSKQELYFVKENHEIFSTEVSAREKQEKNSGGPHRGVIGSLGISSTIRPF